MGKRVFRRWWVAEGGGGGGGGGGVDLNQFYVLFALTSPLILKQSKLQVNTRYLEFQGNSEIPRDIRTSIHKICRIEEKLSPLFHNIFTCCWIFMFRQGPDFHIEISGYSR